MTVFGGYDLKAGSGGPDEGWYYSWGFDTEIPLPDCVLFQDGQGIAVSVVNWGNDGVADFESNPLYSTEFGLATTYEFTGFSLTPSVHYAVSREEDINSEDELWAGFEVSYAF